MRQLAKATGLIALMMCMLVLMTQPLAATTTANDGDWSATNVTLTNTPEAAMMVRTGDIDNLGFGWPAGYDPFSGHSTPSHSYPWTVDPRDPDGTDRIMVITSYNGHPPNGQDGYTGSTVRPANNVRPIVLEYSLNGLTVNSAMLQIFVDDFQAPVWDAQYEVTINDVRITDLEVVINSLAQTGPIGKLITVRVPDDKLDLISSGKISINFDDNTTGAGDGYAVDFVKLLINPSGVTSTGTIKGTVTDSDTGTVLIGAEVSTGGIVKTTTDSEGAYKLTGVPAGLVVVKASASGYIPDTKTVDLVKDTTETADFSLSKGYGVTVSKSGDGYGTVLSTPSGLDCGGTCSYQFAPGTSVVLTATAASDSTFTGWSGDCTGTSPICTLTLSGNKKATATFAASCKGGTTKGPKYDFNADGVADILWYNNKTGMVYVYLMKEDGTILSHGTPATVADLKWKIEGVGDFNGDGKSDLLWRNSDTGHVGIWLMDGTSVSSMGSPATISDLNWNIKQVDDFNKDGKSDVLWENMASGLLVIWYMDGVNISSYKSIGLVPVTDWEIIK
ncbi:MAG: carboxypeptidase regulatory-like domain-containing protein [Candidatus Magnetobacterium sp. LHC-1]|nr:carboxypeptidase regulatory-like domain-containing protein [Nitrospirota bacterium]